ncbi:MAG: D-glucuronyl C5-epimerase family protein [Clostridiaceae bacterium]|nr:D-glucuronyl C5-epimerase family protein [Clostridiaceae bacterium]
MKLKIFKNYLNKILIFNFPFKAGYWNTITHCSISEKPKILGKYYLDFSSKADYPGEFSEKGIPLFSYTGLPLIEQPIVIAQYALGLYEMLENKDFMDEELRNKFLLTANWFETNQVNVKGGKGWYIYKLYPEYGLNKPWISAMTQGEAISVLTRASVLTKNYQFEQLAIEALGPFESNVKDGGLINYFNSIPVYEEFPSPHKTSGVLNGILFALFGVYDLVLLNKNQRAQNIFEKGVDSLKKLVPYYDLNYWTRYYLFDYPKKYTSSFTYHILVAEQLKAMFYLSGESIFVEYAEKWIECSKSFFKKNRALFEKLIYANKIYPSMINKLWK